MYLANNIGMCCAEILSSFGQVVSLLKALSAVCGDDRSRQATTGIREKKAIGGPPLISPDVVRRPQAMD